MSKRLAASTIRGHSPALRTILLAAVRRRALCFRALLAMPSSAEDVLILDGGMGRELQAMGAPFRQPEWSALALIEARAMRCACGMWKTDCDLS